MYIQELQDEINEIEDAFETQTPVNNRFKVDGKYCLAIALYKKLEKYKTQVKDLENKIYIITPKIKKVSKTLKIKKIKVKKVRKTDDPNYWKNYRKKREEKIANQGYIKVDKKFCLKCEKEKKPSEFGINKGSKDGLAYYCKNCMKTNYPWKNTYSGTFETREEYLEYKKLMRDPIRVKKLGRIKANMYNRSWGSGVYIVKCVEGDYIGFSSLLRKRKNSHFCKNKRNDSPIAGKLTPLEFIILEKTNDKNREKFWIKKLKPSINSRMK